MLLKVTPMLRIAFRSRPWKGALLVGCVASLVLACGGKSDSDVFDDGGSDGMGGTGGTSPTSGSNGNGSNGNGTGETNGSGGSGGTGGTQGTTGSNGSAATSSGNSASSGDSTNATSTVGTTSSGTTGSGTTGSGGGPSDDRCLLPLDSGDCDAAFQAWGYNAETGRCEEFLWGGCGGNENRFDSLEACISVCDPAGRTACDNNTECVIDHGCCGFNGIDSSDQLVAVNAKYGSFTAPECGLVDCDFSPMPEELGSFGARCNEGTCEVYDVRKSDLSACERDDDCRLRAGLNCCESCGATNWVAVSTDERVEKELCGDMPAGCPACEPIEPVRTFAACDADGHCQVQVLLL